MVHNCLLQRRVSYLTTDYVMVRPIDLPFPPSRSIYLELGAEIVIPIKIQFDINRLVFLIDVTPVDCDTDEEFRRVVDEDLAAGWRIDI